jgi:septation ring formation regulator EzrA
LKHVVQQLEAEIRSIDNLFRHVSDRRKLAQARVSDLAAEVNNHDATLAGLSSQKDKLASAISGIKSL